MSGQVFTKFFQRDEDSDLHCIIKISNKHDLKLINEIMSNIDSSTQLSTDNNLRKITKQLKENTFSPSNEKRIIKNDTNKIKKEKNNATKNILRKFLKSQYLNTL